jgi:hypothetical protein
MEVMRLSELLIRIRAALGSNIGPKTGNPD